MKQLVCTSLLYHSSDLVTNLREVGKFFYQMVFTAYACKYMCFTKSCVPCDHLFFSFLTQCRPLSVSMGNAIKYLKLQITHTPPDMAEDQVNLCMWCLSGNDD